MTVWKVPSSSDADKKYLVRLHDDGNYSCECKGWQFARSSPRTCQHIKRVQGGEVEAEAKKQSPFMKAKTKEFGFQKPMLAHKLKPNFSIKPGEWAVEEKYDGHRLIVSVHEGVVTAWARSGKERELPPHIVKVLEDFPSGTYDGELTAGKGARSYHVTEKTMVHKRMLVVFDILRLLKQDITEQSYDDRRRYLREIFRKIEAEAVQMAKRWDVDSIREARDICQKIWARDGEGIMLKRRKARYTIGKRVSDVLKLKGQKHAVLTVTGFKASKGDKVDRGPYAIAMLEDAQGNETSVKVLDDAELAKLEAAAKKKGYPVKHPFVGRRLCIDYQERTPSGSYRSPMWDRWEDE